MESNVMLSTESLEPSVRALSATLTGDVVTPRDAEWDLARRASCPRAVR